MNDSTTNDFLAFRKMITPAIIQLAFWIGVVICVLAGIGAIINAHGKDEEIVAGILLMLLGPLAIRIYCELLIIFFRMNETLTEIKNSIERK